jgi:hypothetical protein
VDEWDFSAAVLIAQISSPPKLNCFFIFSKPSQAAEMKPLKVLVIEGAECESNLNGNFKDFSSRVSFSSQVECKIKISLDGARFSSLD